MASDLPYEHLTSDGIKLPTTATSNAARDPMMASTAHNPQQHILSAPSANCNPLFNNAPPTNRNNSNNNNNLFQLSHNCSLPSRRTITLGKPLPRLFVTCIQFLLGINPRSSKRTISGRVFFGLTISFAIGKIQNWKILSNI